MSLFRVSGEGRSCEVAPLGAISPQHRIVKEIVGTLVPEIQEQSVYVFKVIRHERMSEGMMEEIVAVEQIILPARWKCGALQVHS